MFVLLENQCGTILLLCLKRRRSVGRRTSGSVLLAGRLLLLIVGLGVKESAKKEGVLGKSEIGIIEVDTRPACKR